MWKRISVLALAVITGVGVLLPSTAGARSSRAHGPVEVTHGSVVTLPGGEGLGYDLSGRAVMLRTADRTFVALHVRGLDADTTYPVHVHNAPCSATPPGGGHYQHIVGGPVDAVNEIWPRVTTGHLGDGWGHAVHEHRARPDAMSVVIHHPPDTSIRLACIDLS